MRDTDTDTDTDRQTDRQTDAKTTLNETTTTPNEANTTKTHQYVYLPTASNVWGQAVIRTLPPSATC